MARHYQCSPSTVYRIWNNEVHRDIPPGEPPNIKGKPKMHDVLEDIEIYLKRGMKPVEIAERLNIGKSTVYAWMGVFV